MSNRKQFDELNSKELSQLLSDYREHKIITEYGYKIHFSIKWFYVNKHVGFIND